MKKMLPVMILFLLVVLVPTSTQAQSKAPLSDMGLVGVYKYPDAINLESNLLRNSFTSIDAETEDYIIGIVNTDPLYPIHAMVHKSGWFVTFITTDIPASALLAGPAALSLQSELNALVFASTGNYVSDYMMTFHDCRYPDASVLEIIQAVTSAPAYAKAAYFSIPEGAVIFDRSYMVQAYQSNYMTMELDYRTIDSTFQYSVGTIMQSDLVDNSLHLLRGTGYGRAAIILILDEMHDRPTFPYDGVNHMYFYLGAMPQEINSIIADINHSTFTQKIFLPILTR